MDKLAAMRAFVEIADRGSLTAAAAALGKAQPTMVRTLANLESTLGVRLLRRTTRRLSLTDEGRDYLHRCRQILADVDEAERALSRGTGEPRGELRLTAPATYGQWHVAPALYRFLHRFSGVRVDLLLLDRVVNFLEEGIDLAVRIGPLTDSSMVAVPVGQMRRVVVAAPELLAASGPPQDPSGLTDRPCVLFRGLGTRDEWRFGSAREDWHVPVRGPMTSNHAVAAVNACVEGLGFGRFLGYQVAPWVADGRLQIVLEAYEPPPLPVSLVYTEGRLMTSRLRHLIDHLRSALAEDLRGGGLEQDPARQAARRPPGAKPRNRDR